MDNSTVLLMGNVSDGNFSLAPTNSTNPPIQIEHVTVKILYTHVLLLQIIFGSSGNFLNLIVLMSKKMRSRTNLLFALMAFADLAFLLLQMPTYLFFQGTLRTSRWYRSYNQVFTGAANWCSALSIWCMLYATIERVQVLRNPFKAVGKRQVSLRFSGSLVLIAVATLLVTAIHFVPMHKRDSASVLVTVWITSNAFLVVVLPCVISTLLNTLLILALKKHKFSVEMMNQTDKSANRALISMQQRNERKITFMVVVILTSFIICNAPGAILFMLRQYGFKLHPDIRTVLLNTITNSLATTGKMMNFVLFCSSSAHFRQMLLERCKEARACLLGRKGAAWASGVTSFRAGRSASKTLSCAPEAIELHTDVMPSPDLALTPNGSTAPAPKSSKSSRGDSLLDPNEIQHLRSVSSTGFNH